MNHHKIKIISFISIFFLIFSINAQDAQSKEFLNTIMDFNLGVVFGSPLGNTINQETYSYSVVQPSGKVIMRPTIADTSFGVFIDITPFSPIILGLESNAIKFGLRAGIRLNYWQESLTVKELNIDYKGALFEYKNWMAGLLIMYAPVLSINKKGQFTAGGGLNFFCLFGTIWDGKLSAYPVKTLSGDPNLYSTTVTGYRIDAGLGGELSIFSINIGINVFYSYLNLTIADPVPYSGLTNNIAEIHEVCVEIYIGIPIEW